MRARRRIGLVVAAIALAPLAPAPVAAGGAPTVSRGVPVTEYDAIDVSAPVSVRLVTGPRVTGRISGAAAAVEGVRVIVRNRTLIIEPARPVMRSAPDGWRRSAPEPASITLGAPATIARVQVRGAGDVTLAALAGRAVSVRLGGSARLEVAEVGADRMTVQHDGSGTLRLAGRAADVSLASSGSGSTDADALTIDRAVVAATGSGAVRLRVADTAEIASSGSGAIDVAGRATCRITARGNAAIRCEGRMTR